MTKYPIKVYSSMNIRVSVIEPENGSYQTDITGIRYDIRNTIIRDLDSGWWYHVMTLMPSIQVGVVVSDNPPLSPLDMIQQIIPRIAENMKLK